MQLPFCVSCHRSPKNLTISTSLAWRADPQMKLNSHSRPSLGRLRLKRSMTSSMPSVYLTRLHFLAFLRRFCTRSKSNRNLVSVNYKSRVCQYEKIKDLDILLGKDSFFKFKFCFPAFSSNTWWFSLNLQKLLWLFWNRSQFFSCLGVGKRFCQAEHEGILLERSK